MLSRTLFNVHQVKLTDMQLRESPKELLAGSPMCAPGVAVMAEACVCMVRRLHTLPAWQQIISQHMCAAIDTLFAWLEEMRGVSKGVKRGVKGVISSRSQTTSLIIGKHIKCKSKRKNNRF